MIASAASQENAMGSYRYALAADTWQWSDGVYAIHGFDRDEVVPTTALLLSHAHAADRRQAGQLLRACLCDGRLFSLLYRIIDAAGQLRWVLIAGEGTFDGGGMVTGIRGYLVDVTEPQSRARSREVASGLRKATASRATIEQAKGALMLVYGLEVQHLGSVGVALLATCHRRCQTAGTPLRIVAGDGPIASILSMIPIGLHVHDQVAGALAPVSHGPADRPHPGLPGEGGGPQHR